MGSEVELIARLRAAVQSRCPGVVVEEEFCPCGAEPLHLWHFTSPTGIDVQVEPGAQPGVFCIEGDRPGERADAADLTMAIDLVIEWLHLDRKAADPTPST